MEDWSHDQWVCHALSGTFGCAMISSPAYHSNHPRMCGMHRDGPRKQSDRERKGGLDRVPPLGSVASPRSN